MRNSDAVTIRVKFGAGNPWVKGNLTIGSFSIPGHGGQIAGDR
jgi:hypothetical protein